MSYSNVITVDNLGSGDYAVTITETDAVAGSEAVITGLPVKASLLKQICVVTGGAGTTVDPIIGSQTNPSGPNIIAENDTAAGAVNSIAAPAIPFATVTGTLYHRSNVDAGPSTVISRYLFRGSW